MPLLFLSRVLPDITLGQLRPELERQLESKALPSDFVFVRAVGKHFSLVRTRNSHKSGHLFALEPHGL